MEENSTSRKFQIAKENSKVICVTCYEELGQVFFFEQDGVFHHYRRTHPIRKSKVVQSQTNSSRLFQELHFVESKSFLEKLSEFRDSLKSDLFGRFAVKSSDLNMNVTAKIKKEAAKLAGLVLAHKGVIKHLADNGYIVGVIDRDNPNENVEKFSVWKTPEIIYVESIFTKSVSTSFKVHCDGLQSRQSYLPLLVSCNGIIKTLN